jgi:hypothetical protein
MAAAKWKIIPIYVFRWTFFKGGLILLLYIMNVVECFFVFRGELELRNSDDSLMLFACSSLPERIRQNLYSSLLACFNGNEVLVDQTLDKDFHIRDVLQPQTDPSTTVSLEQVVENIIQGPFQCLHFSLWNRYITNVSPCN